MANKFIPNGDPQFADMARVFASNLAKEPGRYAVSEADAAELMAAFERYSAALQASRFGERSATKTRIKDQARAELEQLVRRVAQVVRSNPKVDAIARMRLGLRERVAKAKQLPCPQEPPRLKFLRALHEGNGATPVHELSFRAMDFGVTKPPGAMRLELFVDLVPPDEQVPAHPGANLSSRPWYLRSYTRSPFKLIPPMARVPMRVVYWGRWADSAGNVGPFSATAVGWIEGGMHRMLAPAIGLGQTPVPVQPDAKAIGPGERDASYSVAVLETFYQSHHPTEVPRLPQPTQEMRQLDGPGASEAA